MNLNDFKNWALSQGTVGKFTDGQYVGQCVSLINQYLARVYGIKAGAWGHAWAWAKKDNTNVTQYFDHVSSPQAGDIGVSGTDTGNGDGHIWIYLTPNLVLEQNGAEPLGVSVNAPLFPPVAILRRKGEDVAKPTYQEVLDHFRKFQGSDPTEKQMNYYVARDWGVLNGDLLEVNYAAKKKLQAENKNLKEQLTTEYVEVTEPLYRKKG